VIRSGAGKMRRGDDTLEVNEGSVFATPPAVVHDFRPDGSEPLRALQGYAPGGPEQRFRR
jgi:mannose-6-phosphate isomerase-like protein (cupin superfamily)